MMSCVPILIYLHPREINSRLNIRYFLQTLITHHFYLSHSVDTRSSVVDCNFHSLNTTIRLSISVKHARQRICQILRIFRGLLNERARRPINWVLILEKFQDIMDKVSGQISSRFFRKFDREDLEGRMAGGGHSTTVSSISSPFPLKLMRFRHRSI